ncbi:MAG: hypothetical protein QME62_14130 [Armatimonadota bacterium]|nr:hypothetical protein [Armatimonadota bacterium]
MVVRSSFIRIAVALIIFVFGTPILMAQETAQTVPKRKTESNSTTQTAFVKQKKPSVTRTFDTQLSGFTSKDADQLYLRMSLSEKKSQRNWLIRGAYIRTATKSANTSSHVTTQRIDSRLEYTQQDGDYTVWTGVLSRRDRDRVSKKQPKKSGYHLFSYGVGRQFGTKMKGDIGVGFLEDYDNGTGTKPTFLASIRGRHLLNPKLALESDILLLQPLENFKSTKIDSDISLVHEFAPGLSVRLGWSANNLIRSIRGSHEWDSILRLVIGYRHTSTR